MDVEDQSDMDVEDQIESNLNNTSYIKKYGHNFAPPTKEMLPLMKDKVIPLLRKDH